MWRCTPSFSRRTSRFCSTSPARRARYAAPPWRCSMHELSQPGGWLPLVFMALMGMAMLIYVVLDGYDLGVGILLGFANEGDKDTMVESIGPFWDANETWLVLGIGLLLSAFPIAHGIILGELYLPVAIMLVGLILRDQHDRHRQVKLAEDDAV